MENVRLHNFVSITPCAFIAGQHFIFCLLLILFPFFSLFFYFFPFPFFMRVNKQAGAAIYESALVYGGRNFSRGGTATLTDCAARAHSLHGAVKPRQNSQLNAPLCFTKM